MLVSCGASNSRDNNKITGTYRTIVFIQPAPADYPVDLHEKGGYIELDLKTDLSVKAKWFIPEAPEYQLKKSEPVYKGNYSADGDTIKISGTGSVLDYVTFIYKEGKLEMKEQLRRGPVTLVFKKIEE